MGPPLLLYPVLYPDDDGPLSTAATTAMLPLLGAVVVVVLLLLNTGLNSLALMLKENSLANGLRLVEGFLAAASASPLLLGLTLLLLSLLVLLLGPPAADLGNLLSISAENCFNSSVLLLLVVVPLLLLLLLLFFSLNLNCSKSRRTASSILDVPGLRLRASIWAASFTKGEELSPPPLGVP
jgi:hypothetical protein